jgi:hypothetical protein
MNRQPQIQFLWDKRLAHISARSLDVSGVPGSELFLFQSAISGKNATISLRILAVSDFRHQNEGLRPRFF